MIGKRGELRDAVRYILTGDDDSRVSAFASKEGVAPAVGDKAPDFTLKDAEDQTYSLEKLRGKIVF